MRTWRLYGLVVGMVLVLAVPAWALSSEAALEALAQRRIAAAPPYHEVADWGPLAIVVPLDSGDASRLNPKSPGETHAVIRQQLYDDARIIEWSRLYLAGNRDDVLRLVEADLRSASPHPFSPQVWVGVHNQAGRLEEIWKAFQDDTVRNPLGLLPSLTILEKNRQYAQMLQEVPPARAQDITDPFVLWLVAHAAVQEHRTQDQLAYFQLLAARFPHWFQTAWIMDDVDSEITRKKLAALRQQESLLTDGLLGNWLEVELRWRPRDEQTKVQAVKDWLAMYPRDSRAFRKLAMLEARLGRLGRAAQADRTGVEVFPFYGTEPFRAAVRLCDLERWTEAESWVKTVTASWAISPSQEANLFDQMWADVLLDAGEKGKAREHLFQALGRRPDAAELLSRMARLELTSSRPAHAVALAEKSATINPVSSGPRLTWIEALEESGQLGRGWEMLEEWRGRGLLAAPDYYMRGSSLLQKLERTEDRLSLLTRGCQAYPEWLWVRQELGGALYDAGRKPEAIAVLQESLKIEVHAWTIHKLIAWQQEVGGDSAVDAKLRRFQETYPWDKAVWEESVDWQKRKGGSSEVEQVWERAIAANPGRDWPLNKYVNYLVSQKRWSDAINLGERAKVLLAGSAPSERAMANFMGPYTVAAWSQEEAVPEPVLQGALIVLDRFREQDGTHQAYHLVKARILKALGRETEAAGEVLATSQRGLDEPTLSLALFQEFPEILTFPEAARIGVRVVERDPFDPKRLATLASLHIKYGGSAIVGLHLIELIKVRQPRGYTEEVRKTEGMAYGQLGDARRYFESNYVGISALGNSDRYVGWYDRARKQVQEDKGTRVRLDGKTTKATILSPTGEVIEREDHPVTGRPLLIQKGLVFVRAEYDAKGEDLLRLWSSSGSEVVLTYDARHRIETIRSSDGQELQIAYDPRFNKPSRLTVPGTGEMVVSYDDNGSLKGTESAAGIVVAARVAEMMTRLMSLQEAFTNNRVDVFGQVPRLPHQDVELDALRAVQREALGCEETCPALTSLPREQFSSAVDATLAVARHLVHHVQNDQDYADDARHLLEELAESTLNTDQGSDLQLAGAESVTLWQVLLQKIKPQGLSREDFFRWKEMRQLLDAKVHATKPGDLSLWWQRVQAVSFSLLPPAQWLPRSDWRNSGFWLRYARPELLPKLRHDAELRTILLRRNGDLVLASSAGLSVLRRGYWEWFGFDETRGRWSAAIGADEIGPASDVLALSETEDGALWLGTASGLIRLTGTYDGAVQRWRTDDSGLPSSLVRHMVGIGEAVLIGTSKGLRLVTIRGVETPYADLAGEAIVFLRGDELLDPGAPIPVLIGTQGGLYVVRDNKLQKVVVGEIEDAVWDPALESPVVLKSGKLYAVTMHTEGVGADLDVLPGQGDLVVEKAIYGLRVFPVEEGSFGVAALTDQGVSIFHDWHFEHLDLPLGEQRLGIRLGPRHMTSRHGRTAFVTMEGVYVFERGRTIADTDGRVYDLLTQPEQGRTFVARGEMGLYVVDQDHIEDGPRLFKNIEVTHLWRDREGHLLANDGLTILRFDKGTGEVRTLFRAHPTTPEGFPTMPAEVTSLLVGSDGIVWVTAGPSVFRWKDGAGESGTVEEFSMFKDRTAFPAFSDMLSRVVETHDGRIWVVASSENHRLYGNIRLTGGLLEWTGAGFRILKGSKDPMRWFITGYTTLDKDSGIVGTTQGFARHRGDEYQGFRSLKDASYLRLSERTPLLWLGRRGAKLGNDAWLFGAAGGVLLYKGGQWLYPERLNQMLPDDQTLGQYGGRTVHAVETDAKAHIFVGTDRGLLIYDSQGSPAQFLLENRFEAEAFSAQDSIRLREEATILLSQLKPETAAGKVVAQVTGLAEQIERLEHAVASDSQLIPVIQKDGRLEKGPGESVRQGQPAQPMMTSSREGQLSELRESRRKYGALLARLESENRSLHQMLDLKPIDLSALRARLKIDQVIVQYLPSKMKLYIHVVTREGGQVREVNVTEDTLSQLATEAWSALSRAKAAAAGRRAEPLDSLPNMDSGVSLTPYLAQLYDYLLRPIERELAGKTVFIVPVGKLFYVPFSALVRNTGPTVEYAVERFTLGYLTTLSMFSLMADHQPSLSRDHLVFGDPDGTLSGARKEAEVVGQLLGGDVGTRIGQDASYVTLMRYAEKVRVVHLATHGELDWEHPERSALLLADNYRLGIDDIMTMDLKQTDLVVLSACESGVGANGLEFATMARAFFTAHAPTVVATLWRVPDEPSRRLMVDFYQAWVNGDGPVVALAKAQRQMLKRSGPDRQPHAWAGFLPFGGL